MNFRAFQAMQRVAVIGARFISYVDQGAGEPLILLHGMPVWGYVWSGLLPRLSGECRVLVPDLPGYGYSDKSDRFDRSLASQAAMIRSWMSQLGIERASFVGHGIGGGVALRLATLSPRFVKRLCLLSPVCYDSWPQETFWELGRGDANKRYSSSDVMVLLKQQLREAFACSPGDEMLENLLAPYGTGVGKLSLIRNISALDTNMTTEITALLPRITAPTLIIWGEDDQRQDVKYGERLAMDIPRARLTRVKNARHYAMLDSGAKVAEHVLEFMKG